MTAAVVAALLVLLVLVRILDERATRRLAPWYIGPLHAALAKARRWLRRAVRGPILVVLVASPAGAQKIVAVYGYTKGQAQRVLSAAWRESENERVFCSAREKWFLGDSGRALAVFIDSVIEVPAEDATPNSAMVKLAACGSRGQFHTHPQRPDCNFSRADREQFSIASRYAGRLYDAVVCGDSAVLFQFPPTMTDTGPRLRFTPAGVPIRSALPTLADTILAGDSARAEIARARKTLDSLSREIDKLDSLERRVRGEIQRVFKSRQWFAGALAAGLLANTVWKIDRDPGGYRDVWTTPDKRDHLNSGFFLSSVGMAMGVRPWWAAGLTCASAVGFEFTQGYVSHKDIIAGCTGATVAAGARALRKRLAR